MGITQDDVTACVRLWRDRLYLHGWTLTLDFKRLEGGRAGQCSTEPSYWHAHIDFDLERMSESPARWEQLVVHELLHVVCARVHAHSEAVYSAMGAAVGGCCVASTIGDMEIEAVIERVARVMCDLASTDAQAEGE